MDYRFIFLFLTIGSCTHNTGDSLLYCCLNLIVGVFPIVVLIPVVADDRGNEQATETSEVQYSSPCCWVDSLYYTFIHLFCWDSKVVVFFCTYRLELTSGSSARRWNPYLHHRQVQSTLSSLSRKLDCLMWALSNLPCVFLFMPSPACAPFNSSCYHPRRYLRCLPDGNPALTQVAVHEAHALTLWCKCCSLVRRVNTDIVCPHYQAWIVQSPHWSKRYVNSANTENGFEFVALSFIGAPYNKASHVGECIYN